MWRLWHHLGFPVPPIRTPRQWRFTRTTRIRCPTMPAVFVPCDRRRKDQPPGTMLGFRPSGLWSTGLAWSHGNAVAVRGPPLHAHRRRSRLSMPEAPIETVGVVRKTLSGRVFHVELPNGKMVFGPLPRRLADLASELSAGERVSLEMTPFDFEKARIVGRDAGGCADE